MQQGATKGVSGQTWKLETSKNLGERGMI
jgi:hypothetical protein